jgi:hypothetical protein
VISCVRLLTDKPFGARSVLADPELCKVLLDAATSIMSDWCYQQEHGTTVQAVTAATCSDAVVAVANLLASGERLRPIILCCFDLVALPSALRAITGLCHTTQLLWLLDMHSCFKHCWQGYCSRHIWAGERLHHALI